MRVPYALRSLSHTSRGTLAASANRSMAPFYCPECKEVVTLKKGTRKAPHFAHRAHSACSGGGAAAMHAACAMWIYENITNENLRVSGNCFNCRQCVEIFRGNRMYENAEFRKVVHGVTVDICIDLPGMEKLFVCVGYRKESDNEKLDALYLHGKLIQIQTKDILSQNYPLEFMGGDMDTKYTICKFCIKSPRLKSLTRREIRQCVTCKKLTVTPYFIQEEKALKKRKRKDTQAQVYCEPCVKEKHPIRCKYCKFVMKVSKNTYTYECKNDYCTGSGRQKPNKFKRICDKCGKREFMALMTKCKLDEPKQVTLESGFTYTKKNNYYCVETCADAHHEND